MVCQSVNAQSNIFYNQTFTLSAPSEDTCYYYPVDYVYSAAGSTVNGIISVNAGKVDFYILNSAEYQSLNGNHKGGCNNLLPQHFEFRTTSLSSMDSFTYYVPDSGNHYFVFFNPFSTAATISLVLSWGGTPTTAAYQPVTTYNYPTFTGTFTPFVSSTVNTGAPQTGFNPILLLEVGIIGAVVVVVLIAFVYPTMHKKPPTDQMPSKIVQEQVVPKPSPVAPGKLFCLECGNELPIGSKFCNKCGTQQQI